MIELLGNTPGNGIQLYTIGFAARHINRKQTDKIASAAGRFQDVALLETHLCQRLVNASNHYGPGCRRQSENWLWPLHTRLLIQQGLEFRILAVCFLKALGQPTPSHIAGKDFLFSGVARRSSASIRFKQRMALTLAANFSPGVPWPRASSVMWKSWRWFAWYFGMQRCKGDALTANPFRSQRSRFFFLGL